eukprot:11731209-Alexandrium_andersonii.AAC.1
MRPGALKDQRGPEHLPLLAAWARSGSAPNKEGRPRGGGFSLQRSLMTSRSWRAEVDVTFEA